MARQGGHSATRFVRDRLLPQDRVAVMAYNRATDFTTDRAPIQTTLKRFRQSHDQIEALMRQQFSGLQAAYGMNGAPNKESRLRSTKSFKGRERPPQGACRRARRPTLP